MRELLTQVPQLVQGKIVAVTSFDSGPLALSDEALAAGWQTAGATAYSPLVHDPAGLPLGEWDEWYVLSEMRKLPAVEVFVNYGDFTPDSSRRIEPQRPGWDRIGAEETLRYSLERTERFWAQLKVVRPISYLAENDAMNCVTSDEALFDQALGYARDAARSAG